MLIALKSVVNARSFGSVIYQISEGITEPLHTQHGKGIMFVNFAKWT